MKSTKCFSILVKTIACALMLGSLQAYAAKGYSSSAQGIVIYSPNFSYTTNFSIPSSAIFPSNAKINKVDWKYSIGWNIPSKATFIAWLCHGDDSTCLDVTRIKSGTTTFFNTDGKKPNTPFYLAYRINSGYSFPPISTGSAQLTVNMTY
ncbi:flagellar protein FlhE [Lonsdalea quercina]|uniref:flagellar protein FlhE n=1 Tax=Lonsdalea quercina TaxID=71657 RepID=UPI000945B526|nr:flagellar protein FlhE [Lonsdalea quercina]